MKVIYDGNGGIFFIDAPGGNGKTFLISVIFRYDSGTKSSDIAATLLVGGRTVHCVLKIPLNLPTIEEPTCNNNQNISKGKSSTKF